MTVDYSGSITSAPGQMKNHGDRVAPNGRPAWGCRTSQRSGGIEMLNVCATHRCPNLTTARYCTDCTAPARQASDQRRPSAARVAETPTKSVTADTDADANRMTRAKAQT
jgi:hypothetical protein